MQDSDHSRLNSNRKIISEEVTNLEAVKYFHMRRQVLPYAFGQDELAHKD